MSDIKHLIQKANKELSEVEELLDVEFCDDGLVFYHLQNAVSYLLKALFEEFKISPSSDEISKMIEELENKTTISFPDWIENILELEELSTPDSCGASICYDPDLYGDIIESVYKLKEFVLSEVEK